MTAIQLTMNLAPPCAPDVEQTLENAPVSAPTSSPTRMAFQMSLRREFHVSLQALSGNGVVLETQDGCGPTPYGSWGNCSPSTSFAKTPGPCSPSKTERPSGESSEAFTPSGMMCNGGVIPAAALGAGHRRERLWLVASHADCAGLEGHAGHGEICWETEANRHPAACSLRQREITSPLWYHQSGIFPVVDGLPARLVKDQLTAVGNSLVPQVAYVLMRVIARRLSGAGHR